MTNYNSTDRILLHLFGMWKHALYHLHGIKREVNGMGAKKVVKKVKKRYHTRKEKIRKMVDNMSPAEKEALRRLFFAAVRASIKLLEEYADD